MARLVTSTSRSHGRPADEDLQGWGEVTMNDYPMATDTDGIERPVFVPVRTDRPRVKYVDMGRVIAGGRVYRVDSVGHLYSKKILGSLGWLLVLDDGRLYGSPDRPTFPDHGDTMTEAITASQVGYARMRWVGGFKTRGEVIAYLRAHRDAASEFWAEVKESNARVVARHNM